MLCGHHGGQPGTMCRRGLPGGDDLVTPIDSLSEKEKLCLRFDYISSPAEVRKGQGMAARGMANVREYEV